MLDRAAIIDRFSLEIYILVHTRHKNTITPSFPSWFWDDDNCRFSRVEGILEFFDVKMTDDNTNLSAGPNNRMELGKLLDDTVSKLVNELNFDDRSYPPKKDRIRIRDEAENLLIAAGILSPRPAVKRHASNCKNKHR